MRILAFVLGALAGLLPHFTGPQSSYVTVEMDGYTALLPDRNFTPGLTRPDATEENVCHGGSTRQYRHTTVAMKNRVYALYGAKRKAGVCCEADHLISLELGGADDVKNLWPEPYEPRPGAHEKDEVENFLHREVCAGHMKLADAQKQIADNWLAVYVKMNTAHPSGENDGEQAQ